MITESVKVIFENEDGNQITVRLDQYSNGIINGEVNYGEGGEREHKGSMTEKLCNLFLNTLQQ